MDNTRYRVQIQFDVYADSEIEAAELIGDTIYNTNDIHNDRVIYFAEAPFAKMNHREIDYNALDFIIMNARNKKLINDPLPF